MNVLYLMLMITFYVNHCPPQLMMCSDKLGYIRQPVLSLQLDLSRDGQHKRATFEMSKQELHKMISSLEAANKVYRFYFILCVY